MPRNNAKKWAVISLILTLLGIMMTVAGITLDDDNFIWMFVVGLLLSITFLICFFVFLGQAKHLSRMFNKEELLAHWYFDNAAHLQKAEEEFRAKKKTNRILLTVVTALFVVIGFAFAAFGFDDIEEASVFMLIMAGVLAIIYIAALTSPRASYNRMIKSSPEVFVGPISAWVMGEYVQWKAPMTRLTRVEFEQNASGVLIAIHYEILQRYGYQHQESRIPVPAGKEQEAYTVANNIASINGVEFLLSSIA